MPEVSSMVLVVNTALAGGLALAGSWLASRTQRVARSDDARRADAELMRNMTAELFVEIKRLSSEAAERATMIEFERTKELLEAPSIFELRARVAIYFPNQLPLMDDRRYAERLQSDYPLPPWPDVDDENFGTLFRQYRDAELLLELRAMQFMLKALEAALIKEVRRYVPRGA